MQDDSCKTKPSQDFITNTVHAVAKFDVNSTNTPRLSWFKIPDISLFFPNNLFYFFPDLENFVFPLYVAKSDVVPVHNKHLRGFLPRQTSVFNFSFITFHSPGSF